MKRLLLGLLLTVLFTVGFGSTASATAVLTLSTNGGADTATFGPSASGDLGTSTPFTLGSWNIHSVNGSGFAPGVALIDTDSIDASSVAGAAPLIVTFSQDGFTVPEGSWLLTLGGAQSSVVQQQDSTVGAVAWVNASDALLGMSVGGKVGPIGPISGSSLSGSVVGGPAIGGTYSLTQQFTVTSTGTLGANVSVSESLAGLQAVPEPSSLLLMGSGLLGFVGLARRKLSKS